MINLIGKTVIGNDGYSKRKGTVIGEENPKYGFKSWVIRWSDGMLDTHSKHTLKNEKEHVGIGVYWIEEKEENQTFYIENNSGIVQ